MQLVTLEQLEGDVQLRADVVGSTTTYPLSEIDDYINRGIARVHGLLAKSGEPYYRTLFEFTSASGQQQYYTTSASGVPAGTAVLPTDIFLVESLDVQVNGNAWIPCERMNWSRRNDFQAALPQWPVIASLYEFMGSGATANLFLAPPPAGAIPYRLSYWPVAATLVEESDTWDSANRWDEYVINFAARLVADRDENYELSARLDAAIAQMEATIREEGANRIKGSAPKVRRSRYRRGWGGPWGGAP